MAPSMDSQPVSNPNFGKAANVGAVKIKGDQNNNFAPGANEVNVDRSRKTSTQKRSNKRISYRNTYNTNIQVVRNPDPQPSAPPRWPDSSQDAARYAQLHADPPIPRDYPWSYALGGFAPVEEDARLLDEM